MRVAQINVTATLSTGRIAVDVIGELERRGHMGLIAFARYDVPSGVPYLRIGGKLNVYAHAAWATLADRMGFASKRATRKLVRALKAYRPDVIQLHNLHGYYLHLPTLFAYLRESRLPVVWTLHDCWAFTGHCAYYTMVGCSRWQTGCGGCARRNIYPRRLFVDSSARNWREKRALFSGMPNMTLITPSRWLQQEAARSFLGAYPIAVVPNGIDLDAFRPCEDAEYLDEVIQRHALGSLGARRMLLGVANKWEKRKGLDDFIELARLLPDDMMIVLVGITDAECHLLPKNILDVPRTGSLRELCALYTAADLYVSLSHEESMGMTLIEAMACGTQVLCYDATALPESVVPEVGEVVPVGDIDAVLDAALRMCQTPKSAADCRAHASLYDRRRQFERYVELYERLDAKRSAAEG